MQGPCLNCFSSRGILHAFSVEIVMPLGLALHFTIEITHTEMSRDFLCLGGVWLHFPGFTWSVSYFIVKLLMFYKHSSTSHTWGQ